MPETSAAVPCPYCDETFATAEDWQRHNLHAHMVHAEESIGAGPLPEEATQPTAAEAAGDTAETLDADTTADHAGA